MPSNVVRCFYVPSPQVASGLLVTRLQRAAAAGSTPDDGYMRSHFTLGLHCFDSLAYLNTQHALSRNKYLLPRDMGPKPSLSMLNTGRRGPREFAWLLPDLVPWLEAGVFRKQSTRVLPDCALMSTQKARFKPPPHTSDSVKDFLVKLTDPQVTGLNAERVFNHDGDNLERHEGVRNDHEDGDGGPAERLHEGERQGGEVDDEEEAEVGYVGKGDGVVLDALRLHHRRDEAMDGLIENASHTWRQVVAVHACHSQQGLDDEQRH